VNNKGQALVEFVLILPVFIFLLLVIVDFGIIFNEKNQLENDSLDIINLYKSGKSVDEINEIYENNVIIVNSLDDYYQIVVSTSIKLMTPGLSKIFGDPYVIKVERKIPNV